MTQHKVGLIRYRKMFANNIISIILSCPIKVFSDSMINKVFVCLAVSDRQLITVFSVSVQCRSGAAVLLLLSGLMLLPSC